MTDFILVLSLLFYQLTVYLWLSLWQADNQTTDVGCNNGRSFRNMRFDTLTAGLLNLHQWFPAAR